MSEEFVARMHPEDVQDFLHRRFRQKILILLWQVIVRKAIQYNGQRQKCRPFDQLEDNDAEKCRRGLFQQLGVSTHQRTFSRSNGPSSLIFTRTCCMVSRSRSVTVSFNSGV